MKSRITVMSLIVLQSIAVITAPALLGYFYDLQSQETPNANLLEVPRKEALNMCPVAVFIRHENKEMAIIVINSKKELEYHRRNRFAVSYLPMKLPKPHKPMTGYTEDGIAIGEYTYLGLKNGQHYFKAWMKVPNQRVFSSWYTANAESTHALYISDYVNGYTTWREYEFRQNAWLFSFVVWFAEGLLLFVLPLIVLIRSRRRNVSLYISKKSIQE